MSKLYKHYSEYSGPWPWTHFAPKEISCKHCGEMYLDQNAMDALERLRVVWGKPIKLNSAHRCVAHNKNEGGAVKSEHLTIAFDCLVSKAEQEDFVKAARAAGFTCTRPYPNNGFVHIDMGRDRKW